MNFEAPTRLARLRWDMVFREFQRRGVGTFLVQSRLYLIFQNSEIRTVSLGTSQYSYRFYEKMGFSTLQVVPDGIAPGLDEYLMQLKLEGKLRSTLVRFGQENAISWEAVQSCSPSGNLNDHPRLGTVQSLSRCHFMDGLEPL